MPVAVTKFSQKVNELNASVCELGKIIEGDSGLTCELLWHVNSSALGLSQKASSATQAIGFLGIRESQLFLSTKAIQRAMRGRESKLINIRDFWNTNMERAILARVVAGLLGAETETTFTAGMLQDFLLPALTNDLFAKYLDFTKPEFDESVSLVQYEKKNLGWDHAEAAARVMFIWGFPDELICCALLHHHGLKLLADRQLGRTSAPAVAVSALMLDAMRQVPNGLAQLVHLSEKWPTFDLLKIAETVDQEFREISPGTSNPFAFQRRCEKMLAGAR